MKCRKQKKPNKKSNNKYQPLQGDDDDPMETDEIEFQEKYQGMIESVFLGQEDLI